MGLDGKHSELTEQIIGAYFKVYDQLGYGFSENVYENALMIELEKLELTTVQQAPIAVYYERTLVGEYRVDILVNDAVLVEIKAERQITDDHEALLMNTLKATPVEVGLLLNFGPKPQHLRKIFDNERKGLLSWQRPE